MSKSSRFKNEFHNALQDIKNSEDVYNQLVIEQQAIEVLIDPESSLAQDADYGIDRAVEIISNIDRFDLSKLSGLADAIDLYEREQTHTLKILNKLHVDLNNTLMDMRYHLIYFTENRLDGINHLLGTNVGYEIVAKDLRYIFRQTI